MNKNNFQIFLDIDGPLVSYLNPEGGIQNEPVQALNEIIKFYNADLCMISSWNNDFADDIYYFHHLKNHGIIVNGFTVGDNNNRDGYIVGLINEGLKRYLIIDDEAHAYYSSMHKIEYKRILQPNRYRCLDKYDVLHVTKNWKL